MTPATQHSVARAREGADHLSVAHQQLGCILEELDSELSASFSHWEDSAVSAYLELQESLHAAASQRQEILRSLSGTAHG